MSTTAQTTQTLLRQKLGDQQYERLAALDNPKLHAFVAEAIALCDPASVFVCTDDPKDIAYVREQAVAKGEETRLAIAGHTVHLDGFSDQGCDRGATKYLVPAGDDLGKRLSTIDRNEGLAQIRGYLQGAMAGREMLVRFFCLGPVGSQFSLSGVQLTDSYYVGHSEDLLCRTGYEQFKALGDSGDFFRVLHSSGAVDEHMCSVDTDKRKTYIDYGEDLVYSVNTQYAGNTVGFKKLALRLALRKADREGWLAEHTFLMGVNGPGGRKSYFAGAFPSMCGKTSTAMWPGETIVGDDIAYLRVHDGRVYGANVECGLFGIIQDVNGEGDPVIWSTITTPGEVIFSNVLKVNGNVYWLGDGRECPEKGWDFSGEWFRGKEVDGEEVPPAHPNACYTVRLRDLPNLDPLADDPAGVPLGAIVYGGRDSDTSVPVKQALNWAHGVITIGASLESEPTAAVVDKQAARAFQPMSNADFVSIPLGQYIQNHLDFGAKAAQAPLIFGVNYFLRGEDGKWLNGVMDKHVWIKWAELRANGDVETIATPVGLLPLYEDLQVLFTAVLGRDYPRELYERQFTLRIPENLAKLDRVSEIYRTDVENAPAAVFEALAAQRERLLSAQAQHGDYVSPFDW